MVESFTLKKDSNNIPVCAYQVGANALNYVAWVAVQVVDDTQTTDAGGVFTTINKPVLDTDGDGEITAADVLPRRTDTGVTLYVGTVDGEVDSNAGKMTLYTDQALTVPAAGIEVKCTDWTLVPLAVDSSGRLVLAPMSSVEVSASALPNGAATEATLATLATEATLNGVGVALTSLATQATLAAVETLLTAVKDTDGIKQITNALPAGTNKLGLMGITNAGGDRHAHVHASLGDEEDFTQSLSSSAFLLTYDSTAGKWKRFKVAEITDILNAIMDALTATGRVTTKTVTIANGQSLSGEVDLEDYSYVAVMMPAAWDAADLTFQASNSSGGTFYDVYDDAGLEVQVSAAAQRVIGLDLAALKLAALKYIKIRSGTSGTPMAQGADRDLVLILKK